MSDLPTPCTSCGQINPECQMWRVTRRPDAEVVFVDERTLRDRGPVLRRVSGPDHLLICVDCWKHIGGWLTKIHEVRTEGGNR